MIVCSEEICAVGVSSTLRISRLTFSCTVLAGHVDGGVLHLRTPFVAHVVVADEDRVLFACELAVVLAAASDQRLVGADELEVAADEPPRPRTHGPTEAASTRFFGEFIVVFTFLESEDLQDTPQCG